MKFNPVKTCQELKELKIESKPFFVGARKKTLIKDGSLIKKFQNLQYNEFETSNDLIGQIKNEKNSLIEKFEEFYYKKCGEDLTVEEIFTKLCSLTLRMVKLQMVFNPTYYPSIYEKKDSKIKYDKVKIVWIDNEGVKHKNTTRTYGQAGEESLFSNVVKFLVENEKVKTVKEEKIIVDNKTYRFDLMVELNNEEWVFEIKVRYKEDFIKDMVRFDLWEIYKKEYKL